METLRTSPSHRRETAVDFDEIHTPPRPLLTVLRDLAGSLADDAKHLVSQELALVKAEAEKKASIAKKEIALIAVSLTLALTGLALTLVALAFGSSLVFQALGLPGTLSYLTGFGVFGLLITGAGIALLLRSKKHLAREGIKPKKAAEQLNETTSWAKNKIK